MLYFIYHALTAIPASYSYSLEVVRFQRQMDLFARLRTTDNSSLWPEVTFDDGHISDYEHALPILLSHSLTAQFFITSGWTGKKPGYMGWNEVRGLASAGQLVGAHGWSHRLLTHCSQEELKRELVQARAALEDRLGCAVTTMSLPGGRYNRGVIAACQEAGYTRVYGSIPVAARNDHDYLVGRMNVHSDMSLERFKGVLQSDSGELGAVLRRYQMKAIAKTLMGDELYGTVWRVVNRGVKDECRGDEA